MALAGREKPLSLILEQHSGYGKTTTLVWLFPTADTEKYFYRSDNFTPKAFVSHAANTAKALDEIDMLPRIRNKVLVTKELAPIFRGRKEELEKNFSMLITVLDGLGYVSDTGMQGQRGYAERHVFNWLGATTPVPRDTHRMMSQLGTRLLFWEMPLVQPTELELLAYAARDDKRVNDDECRRLTGELMADFFARHPVGSVKPDSIRFPGGLLSDLVRWSQLLVRGRAPVHYEDDSGWKPVAAGVPEGPWKVVDYFKELARGHALIEDRDEVTAGDLELVGHTALSSMPGHLRPILRELRLAGAVSTKRCSTVCVPPVSQPTARNYLQELALLGIGNLSKGSPATSAPDTLKLAPDFRWLHTGP